MFDTRQTTLYTIVPHVLSSDRRDRPELFVDIEQIVYLKCLGFKWSDIANMIGVSVCTLHCRREDANLGDIVGFTDTSDEEVCRQLLLMKNEFPDIGERMAIGVFRSKGIIIP